MAPISKDLDYTPEKPQSKDVKEDLKTLDSSPSKGSPNFADEEPIHPSDHPRYNIAHDGLDLKNNQLSLTKNSSSQGSSQMTRPHHAY